MTSDDDVFEIPGYDSRIVARYTTHCPSCNGRIDAAVDYVYCVGGVWMCEDCAIQSETEDERALFALAGGSTRKGRLGEFTCERCHLVKAGAQRVVGDVCRDCA